MPGKLNTGKGPNSGREAAGGNPIVLSPPTFNRFASAADYVENVQNTQTGAQLPQWDTDRDDNNNDVVKVRNDCGVDLKEGWPMVITGAIFGPGASVKTDQERAFLNRYGLIGVPASNPLLVNQTVITTGPHPDGQIRDCVVSGIVPARVDVQNAGDWTAGFDYAGGGSELKGGRPGLPIIWKDQAAPAGEQWCLIRLAPNIPYGRVVFKARANITPNGRAGDTPGNLAGDLKWFNTGSGQYEDWRLDETIYNWSESDFTDEAWGFAVLDGGGNWKVVAEECAAGADPMPEPPAGTGADYVGRKDSPGYWVPAAVQNAGLTNLAFADRLRYDSTQAQWVNSPVGVGSMYMASQPTAGADIGIAWQTLNQFDTVGIAAGVTFDVVSGTFSFDDLGYWSIDFQLSFLHDSSNDGRVTGLRIYDQTGAVVASDTRLISTGRNSEGSSVTAKWTPLVNVGQTVQPGDVLRFEIGGFDSYSSVEYITQALSLSKL